jgi:hypothetical protein
LIAFGLAVASVVLALVSAAGFAARRRLARGSLRSGRTQLWRTACFLSSLFPWAVLALVFGWLIVLAQTQWFGTGAGTVVGSILVGGLAGAYLFAQIQSGWRGYWRAIHNSLDEALPAAGPRRQRFNEDHLLLLNGGEAGATALLRIVALSPPTTYLPT